MNKNDFILRITDDPKAIVEGKLTHLRLYLSLATRELRDEAGLTQKELAQRLGVQQAAVSKLESANKDHDLESVLRHLAALDAELLMAVKKGDDVFQVSDDEDTLLVDVPAQVAEWAEEAGKDPREYVNDAVVHYRETQKSLPAVHL
jgi:transcriptional regulator with XRE-family HTH domain